MDLIVLLLACVGVTLTFVHMEIMDILKLRPLWEKHDFFKKLFHCSACTGAQVGFWYGIPCFILAHIGWLLLFHIFTLPFASLAVCFMFERVVILADNLNIKLEKAEPLKPKIQRKRLTTRNSKV